MTANDKALIEKARKLNCIHWAEADVMAEQADTEKAKQELKEISKHLYRKEEFYSGLI